MNRLLSLPRLGQPITKLLKRRRPAHLQRPRLAQALLPVQKPQRLQAQARPAPQPHRPQLAQK
jgi:hypothetical protein